MSFCGCNKHMVKRKVTKTKTATHRSFHRSTKNKVLAGVCGGLAEYFNIDPLIVRSIFIGLAFIDGSGIILYVLLWIFTPVAGKKTN